MRVGVIGAGFAGLRTAMRLEAAGHDVEIFEARDRLGGRCAGFRYEEGGEWIDSDQPRVLALLTEFGLRPVAALDYPRRYRYLGEWSDSDALPESAARDMAAVESAAEALCGNLANPLWHSDNAPLDTRSVADFIREHTESDIGRWYVESTYRSDEGEDLDRIGLLGWLAGYRHYLNREGGELSAYRFPGGAMRILDLMTQTLWQRPHLNEPVRAIRRVGNEVEVETERRMRLFDRVVVTVPPSVVAQIDFEPALPREIRDAYRAFGMSRAIKAVLQFRTPWWGDLNWGGSMQTDTPIMQTWTTGFGETPFLAAYVCGDAAERLLSQADPIGYLLGDLQSMFRPEAPNLTDQFVTGEVVDWIHDPYALGAFSHLAPGFVTGHLAHIGVPVGPIHFAGEHTAQWVGFIEGALESADRVAAEILSV